MKADFDSEKRTSLRASMERYDLEGALDLLLDPITGSAAKGKSRTNWALAR